MEKQSGRMWPLMQLTEAQEDCKRWKDSSFLKTRNISESFACLESHSNRLLRQEKAAGSTVCIKQPITVHFLLLDAIVSANDFTVGGKEMSGKCATYI